MLTIPTRALPEYAFEVTLDAIAYRCIVKWNTRGAYYTIDFQTREGVEIISGLKLALNATILRQHPGLGLPPGDIIIIDPAGIEDPIEFDDLEGRISLVYLTEADIAAL